MDDSLKFAAASGAATDRIPVTHGSLLDFPRDPIACMKSLHAEHGDMAVLDEDGQRIVFVFCPELNRHVLGDTSTFHSRFFAVRGGRRSSQRRVTSGLLSMNGPQHRENRRLLMEPLSKRVLPEYHSTICDLTCELMDDWQTGDVRDLNTDMVQLMLRMTGALLFGMDDPEFTIELGRKIYRWVHLNHDTGMGAMVSDKQFLNHYDELLSQADDLEADVLQMLQRNRQAGERPNITSILQKAFSEGSGADEQYLSGHLTLLFGAAHLTTAHSFSWTLFLLSQHPDVLRKVKEEIDREVGGDVPTFEEVNNLTYLEQVIKESMRVLPASSYSQRIVADATTIRNVHLGAGTPVIFSQYITHHRADLYEDPDAFRPERWDSIAPSAYEYLPFGAGARMCIGAMLAVTELRTALSMILRRFSCQIEEGAAIDGKVISTMLGPTTPILATLLPPTSLPQTAAVTGNIHDLVDLPVAVPQSGRRAA